MRRLFFVLFFCLGFFAFAQENGDRTVSYLKIEGLKKTKKSYVQKILSGYIGKKESEIKLNEVESILQEQNLFSEIDVEIVSSESENTDAVLSIKVSEKITFIPLPFASYTKDGVMGGFILMDMNALGKHYSYVAGGVFSRSIQLGMLSFTKPSTDFKHPGFSVFTTAGKKDIKIRDFYGNDYSDFSSLSISTNFSIKEKINDFLSANVGVQYSLYDIFDDDVDSYNHCLGFLSFELKKSVWTEWFMYTNSFSAKSEWGGSSDGDFVHGYTGMLNLQVPVVPRLRLEMSMAAAFDFNKSLITRSTKSDVGSTILDSKFRSDRIMKTGMTLEGAVLKSKIGILSLYGSYEVVIARDVDNIFELAHGPGFGALMYLKKVAFPAVVVGGAYNIPQNSWQYVISIGASF